MYKLLYDTLFNNYFLQFENIGKFPLWKQWYCNTMFKHHLSTSVLLKHKSPQYSLTTVTSVYKVESLHSLANLFSFNNGLWTTAHSHSMCNKNRTIIIYPRADGVKRRARLLIPPGFFPPGESKALAKSKVHQWSRAWLTNNVSVGGHPHWSQNMWRTVMNSKYWLVQFKVCIITTARRQRNSKHFLIW
jgi:hypothetical protein